MLDNTEMTGLSRNLLNCWLYAVNALGTVIAAPIHIVAMTMQSFWVKDGTYWNGIKTILSSYKNSLVNRDLLSTVLSPQSKKDLIIARALCLNIVLLGPYPIASLRFAHDAQRGERIADPTTIYTMFLFGIEQYKTPAELLNATAMAYTKLLKQSSVQMKEAIEKLQEEGFPELADKYKNKLMALQAQIRQDEANVKTGTMQTSVQKFAENMKGLNLLAISERLAEVLNIQSGATTVHLEAKFNLQSGDSVSHDDKLLSSLVQNAVKQVEEILPKPITRHQVLEMIGAELQASKVNSSGKMNMVLKQEAEKSLEQSWVESRPSWVEISRLAGQKASVWTRGGKPSQNAA